MTRNWKWYACLPYYVLIIVPAIMLFCIAVALAGGPKTKLGLKIMSWNPNHDILWLNAVSKWWKS